MSLTFYLSLQKWVILTWLHVIFSGTAMKTTWRVWMTVVLISTLRKCGCLEVSIQLWWVPVMRSLNQLRWVGVKWSRQIFMIYHFLSGTFLFNSIISRKGCFWPYLLIYYTVFFFSATMAMAKKLSLSDFPVNVRRQNSETEIVNLGESPDVLFFTQKIIF